MSQYHVVSIINLFNNLSKLLLHLTLPFQRFFVWLVGYSAYIYFFNKYMPKLILFRMIFTHHFCAEHCCEFSTGKETLYIRHCPEIRPESFHLTEEKEHVLKAAPLPPLCTSLLSTAASLFLPCTQAHLYHLSRFHTHVLVYNICFSEELRE